MGEFESFLIATCADYKHWLKNWVYFNGHSYSPVNYRDHHHCAKASSISIALLSWRFQQSKIEQLEKQQRINSECINNLVQQKADYLHKVTMAIAHLDSFDHSKAGMNQLVRSIESALEALRGES